ncbi:hypothetical protein J2S26_002281, partial [Streptococcus dysgalactiae]|nr:hypothetical protein [Streptococcus dysgalactiae]
WDNNHDNIENIFELIVLYSIVNDGILQYTVSSSKELPPVCFVTYSIALLGFLVYFDIN